MIFDKRVAFKPFEYPKIVEYKKAISSSFWLIDQINVDSDIQDFHVRLNPEQRNAAKRTMLAISQIEVAVKDFWGGIGVRFPKAEFKQVGYTYAESEVRHADAYSELLERLNLNTEFNSILDHKPIQGRVEYLQKCLAGAMEKNNKDYTLTLALFSIFVENVSLFSQFAIMQSFYKHLNFLKGIDNVVQATKKEELIHALLGVYIINQVKQEYPEWFDDKFYEKVYEASDKAFKAECGIIDWIFEDGELEFLPKSDLKEYIKNRFNESIKMIGGKDIFSVQAQKLSGLTWFEEEILGTSKSDFFHQHPVDYCIGSESVTAEDLF